MAMADPTTPPKVRKLPGRQRHGVPKPIMPDRGCSSRRRKYNAHQANAAVRLLCDYLKDDDDFVLMADHRKSVYLIPAVQSKESTEDRKMVGHVQFQVSDAMPGSRTTSIDFYDLSEAVAFFRRVQEHGWEKASRMSD